MARTRRRYLLKVNKRLGGSTLDVSTLWYLSDPMTLRLPRTTTSSAMTQPLKIDFVSDVACPWCVIGLPGLEQALANAADAVEAEIAFQPFELNPSMPA